jgi:hypothetical protein
VSGLIEHLGEIVGVYGDVLTGHERYRGMTATLFRRLDNSDWRRDNLSHAQFKVGRGPARLNHNYPYFNPEGTDVDGYPIIMRFASVDSRASEEPAIDSATEAFRKSKAESRLHLTAARALRSICYTSLNILFCAPPSLSRR